MDRVKKQTEYYGGPKLGSVLSFCHAYMTICFTSSKFAKLMATVHCFHNTPIDDQTAVL